jgi:pimeloyl-ACP methyl ester carboxylesterase
MHSSRRAPNLSTCSIFDHMRRALKWIGGTLAVGIVLVALLLSWGRWQASQRESTPAAQLAPRSGRYVPAADVRIFLQEAGSPDLPTVLFVHGTGAWSETWRESMRAIADGGFHAVAIDLPPFGYSDRPQPPLYDKASQGQRIVAVLDALHVQRAIFVGHSFGGGPTVEAALLAPDRLNGLILVDAALSIRERDAVASEPSPLINALLGFKPLRNAMVGTFFSNPRYTKKILQSFIADPAQATDERVAIYQQPLFAKGTTQAFGEWLPALIASRTPARSENPDEYRNLTMPVAVIWGELDTITPLPQGKRLASLAPHAVLTVLQNVGHIPQVESPARFNAALLRALRTMSPAESAQSPLRSPNQMAH